MNTRVWPQRGLELHGILNPATVSWNPGVPALYEAAVLQHEGLIATGGPLVCRTGLQTGRSPGDKVIVR